MKEYALEEFLEKLVLPDLQRMIDHELHYYAFAVICQAIEVMGAIYDQKPIDDFGASETRFDNAITNLFRDRRYKEKQKLFFSVLRGPLIHQLRPGDGLFLSSEKRDKIKPENHLTKHPSSGVILVVERFYEDLRDAFGRFKKVVSERTDLDLKKVNTPFIRISEISPSVPTTWWNKDSEILITLTPTVTGKATID